MCSNLNYWLPQCYEMESKSISDQTVLCLAPHPCPFLRTELGSHFRHMKSFLRVRELRLSLLGMQVPYSTSIYWCLRDRSQLFKKLCSLFLVVFCLGCKQNAIFSFCNKRNKNNIQLCGNHSFGNVITI